MLVAASLAVIAGCRNQPRDSNPVLATASPAPSPSSPPPASNGPGQSVVDCIKQIPFLERGETLGLLKAWKSQPGFDKYGMVEPTDFQIPAWVSREPYAKDVERATGWSHDYGELSGAYGLVLFMFDKTAVFPGVL